MSKFGPVVSKEERKSRTKDQCITLTSLLGSQVRCVFRKCVFLCRHKPTSKFTCNSYEGNLSCLTNSGLLRSRPSDAIKKSYLRHFPASISLKIKGSKLSETLHTCRVLRWSCCSQSLIIACEARTKDFHRPLKFCLSLSPSLLLLVLFNFPFFTFFLGPFD